MPLKRCKLLPLLALALPACSLAQATLATPRPPNAAPYYSEMRNAMPAGAGIQIKGVDLQRDQATVHLASGTVWFYPKANGHDTGAVFEGTGSFELKPEDPTERHSMKTVLKTEDLHLDFTSAVFRFTDGTAEELRKASAGDAAASGQANGPAHHAHDLFRDKLHYNIEERLLQDVLREGDHNGRYFLAEFKGTGLLGKQYIYEIDPEGAFAAAPDQVALLSSGDASDEFDVSVAFKLGGSTDAAPVHLVKVTEEAIDTTIARSGYLTGQAVMKFTALHNGVRVLPFPLYATLRMGGVYDASGQPLDFIQENKDKDPQFAVVLAKPLKAGEESSITFSYQGKDLVYAEGQGNYYPVGRQSWFPAAAEDLGTYLTYDLTFRVPKDVQVVATGDKVSDTVVGSQLVSVWHTRQPIAVAGFSIGKFVSNKVETPDKKLLVEGYANEELPDYLEALKHRSTYLATMNSTSMLNTALNEGDAAFQVYDDYFGPLAYDHVALTQQAACNYGQSWPMLVYLPVCYFLDSTTRHILGLDRSDATYWNNVVAHETAHQWWGQSVGFASYRDQWMSEGFADWSASLYLQRTRKTMDAYHEFWRDQQKRVTEKTVTGVRAIDIGPLTMGYRVSSSKAGEDIYQRLIYSKGAYVPHMLELMFFTNAEGDKPFKAAMHDFVESYRNKPASTEDFKSVMEKHMPRTMDLDHNGKLDWFFNEWVYGTELPHYVIESNVISQGGANELHFNVTQSGVSDSFKMLVPLYLELKDGKVLRIATLPLIGNTTLDKTVNLPKDMQAKRALLNANEDVLSD